MKLHLSLRSKVCISFLLLMSSIARAEEYPLVEVEVREDNLASYKERRQNHGLYFGVSYEALKFTKFISAIDGLGYGEVFGTETVGLIQAEMAYKYNFFLGSLALGGFYGQGSLTAGESSTLDIKKYGISVKYSADMFMSEPYFVPYLGVGIWKMGITEDDGTTSISKTTDMGLSYTLGILLQLNWIDYETAKLTTFNWGLENTFIDIYAVQYAKTQAADDPNTETDFLLGAGLKLEF